MISQRSEKKHNNAGLTLVELLVVLIVLGILASAAVYGVIGYINLTRFNKNNETAQSIYQSAQSSLTHMSENGLMNDWAFKLSTDNNGVTKYGTPVYSNTSNPGINDDIYSTENASKFDIFPNTPDTQRGLSVHMRYALTYTPGSSDKQSELILALIKDDLKSTDVLNGIITIEFDVEKKLDSNGKLHYDANVNSVFYDSRRKTWDDTVYNGLTDKTVPCREEGYRRQTSYIGYFGDSTEIAAVDNVYVPNDAEIKDVIFTLRNGETLDMTWSVTSEDPDAPKTGIPEHFHYTFTLFNADFKDTAKPLDNTDSNIANDWPFCYLIVDENSIHNGNTHNGIPTNILNTQSFHDELKANLYGAMGLDVSSTFVPANFANINGKTSNALINNHNYNVVYTSEKITDENGTPINIYRVSTETVAKVYVHKVKNTNDKFDYDHDNTSKPDLDSNYYSFPFKISYDVYEISGKILSERVSYTLSLDAMMSRSVWDLGFNNNTHDQTQNYSIKRLLNITDPKKMNTYNIFAKMQVLPNSFKDSLTDPGYNYPSTKPFTGSEVYFAERAFDDPVYLLQDGKIPVYRYGDYGQKDYGKGYALVNTFFGDLENGSLGYKDFVGNAGGDAVITSCRHLYNIRMISQNSSVPITYRIKRDLNWFSIYEVMGVEKYYSDVVVYTTTSGGSTSLVGNSPVPVPNHATDPTSNYGDVLNVVSFPSLPTLNANSTLIAEENRLSTNSDPTSVINNIQMRLASFAGKNGINNPANVEMLPGYGLINDNYGKVINIRANGLTLNFNNTPDGSPDDRSGSDDSFSGMVEQIFDTDPTKLIEFEDALSFTGSHPAGGLIGANNGTVGDSNPTNSDPKTNTIRLSNCVITSAFWNGSKWKVYKTSAIGGIIGDNGNASKTYGGDVYGHLETTGCFVTAGWINVSSAIGYTVRSINADIKVDNSNHITDDKFKNDPDYKFVPYVDEYGNKPIIKFSDENGEKVYSVLYVTADSVGAAIGSAGPTGQSLIDCQFKQLACPLTMSSDTEGKITVTGDTGKYAIDVNLGEGSFIIMKTDSHPKYTGDVSKKQSFRQTGIGGAVGRIAYSRQDNLSIRVINNGYIISSEGGTACKHMGGAVGVITNCSINNIDISVINNGSIGPYSIANTSTKVHSVGGAVGKIENMQSSDSNIRILAVNNGDIYGNCSHIDTYDGKDASGHTVFVGSGKNQGGIGGALGAFTGSNGKLPVMMIRSVYASGTISGDVPTSSTVTSYGVGGAVGYMEFMPKNSHIYSSVAAGLSITSTGNNVGGCLGSQAGKIETFPNLGTTITADLATGAAVTSAASNAGGAAGNIETVDAGLKVLTRTSGTLNIKADKNAGGVSGRVMPHSESSTSEFILKPTAAYNINISATTESAGGIIGLADYYYDKNKPNTSSSVFGSTLTLPSQSFTSADTLTVTAGKNAGGMIGHLKSTFGFSSKINVIFNSKVVIEALDETAGGCIGLFEGFSHINNTYTCDLKSESLSISDPATTVSGVPYDQKIVAANKNAGGVIGCISGKVLQKATSEISFNSCNVKVLCEKTENAGTPSQTVTYGSNIGGCIGLAENNAVLSGTVRVGPDLAPTDPNAPPLPVLSLQGTNVGSCMGSCENSRIDGKVVTGFATIKLDGKTGIGGCIGKLEGGISAKIDNKIYLVALDKVAQITFNTSGAFISGDGQIGGCIGTMTGSADIRGTIQFASSKAIIGPYTIDTNGNPVVSDSTSPDTGGVIGKVSPGSFNDTAKILFSGSECTISGGDHTGGIIGYTEMAQASENVEYKFTGTKIVIKGATSTGGIIGASIQSSHKGKITMSPTTTCSVTGSNNVGGCVGLASKRYSNNEGNLPNYPAVIISGCEFSITGSGSTGGILGVAEEDCWYSGGNVEVTNGAKLYVKSTNSAAGGNIGCIGTTVNIGKGTGNIKISCTGENSRIEVTGNTAAGGLVGSANDKGKVNQPVITFKVDSKAAFIITATADNGCAGGIVGYNKSNFGRDGATINLPEGGGKLIIKAKGNAGALVGKNDEGKFTGTSNYRIRAIINEGNPAQLNSKAFLVGNSANVEKFSFYANTMKNSATNAPITDMTLCTTNNVTVINSL